MAPPPDHGLHVSDRLHQFLGNSEVYCKHLDLLTGAMTQVQDELKVNFQHLLGMPQRRNVILIKRTAFSRQRAVQKERERDREPYGSRGSLMTM